MAAASPSRRQRPSSSFDPAFIDAPGRSQDIPDYTQQQFVRPQSQYTTRDQPQREQGSPQQAPYRQSQYNPAVPARPSRETPRQFQPQPQQPQQPAANGWEPEDDYDDSPDNDDNDDFFNGSPNGGGVNTNNLLSPGFPEAGRPPSTHASNSVRAPSPPPTGPLLDHSHLRPGKQAALLSHERTLELYRANAKKTQDPELQFEFAVFMIDAAKSLPIPANEHGNLIQVEKAIEKREDLLKEAIALLKRLADRGHPASQYFLADCYSNGIGTPKGKQDFDRAYPLFVLAAKHGHPDAAYRAGTCCENGWGCRRESAKAVTFYKKAAASLHPGALYRLGTAEINGDLGLSKNAKEGVKWLKRSAENATQEFPHALHELALLHERGVENVVFVDYEYSVELLAQASELGYAPSAFRLGECYEYGKMGCPQDPALSIHYYNIAAQQNHRDACFALTAWYLVGSPGVLPQSDTEAFLWAERAAKAGLAKAMYACGYFLEVGIGTPANPPEAISWYKRAAADGDKRAQQRLKTSVNQPLPGGPNAVLRRGGDEGDKKEKDKDCVIM